MLLTPSAIQTLVVLISSSPLIEFVQACLSKPIQNHWIVKSINHQPNICNFKECVRHDAYQHIYFFQMQILCWFCWLISSQSYLLCHWNPSRQKRKREFFFSFKSMVGCFYSSNISLFDSLCFFFFDLLYFLSLGMFDCQFILNLAKNNIVLLYVSSNGFGKTKYFGSIEPFRKGNWQIYCGWWRRVLLASIVDGSSFDGDKVLAANYGYFKRQHEILWNGNLCASIIFNREIQRVVLSRWFLLEY